MARYDVTVRVRSGWPPSGSDLYAMRQAARRLPRPLRLRSELFFVGGDCEIVLRTRGLPAAMTVHQIRLALPMLGLRRDDVLRIDVVRRRLFRSRRDVLASWLPAPRDRTNPPPPPWSGSRRSTKLNAG